MLVEDALQTLKYLVLCLLPFLISIVLFIILLSDFEFIECHFLLGQIIAFDYSMRIMV